MIERIIVPLLLFIVLPDVFFELHYMRHVKNFTWWKRVLWWIPATVMVVYSICLANTHDFLPRDIVWLEVYFFLMAFFVAPKAMYAACSSIGWMYRKLTGSKYNWGNLIGVVLGLATAVMFIYGLTRGFSRLEVKHIDLSFSDLPQSFDGYRIVHFTDAHVGTYIGRYKKTLRRDIDSINAQHGDMIVFTGDLQNCSPAELYKHQEELESLQAPDGVFSVLGNHDYSKYIENTTDPAIKVANERETQAFERSLGWNLLMNEHAAIGRGKDSVYISGLEYDEVKPYPFKADIGKAIKGIPKKAFNIMLVHTPARWKDMVLPKSKAQLTLAGHTHGGQVMVFGFRPTMLSYKEDYGLFEEAGRYLEVSAGIGGTVPFRLGAAPEIVVITLHKK